MTEGDAIPIIAPLLAARAALDAAINALSETVEIEDAPHGIAPMYGYPCPDDLAVLVRGCAPPDGSYPELN